MKVRIFFIALAFLLLVPLSRTHAQYSVVFGGRITAVKPCTCDEPGTVIITVGAPRPAYILFRPFISTLYQWYSPYAGRWALGQYTPGAGTCSMYYGVTCGPWYTQGLITKIGTSLF